MRVLTCFARVVLLGAVKGQLTADGMLGHQAGVPRYKVYRVTCTIQLAPFQQQSL